MFLDELQLTSLEIKNQIYPIDTQKLYGFLGSKQDYSDWIKNKISQYGYLENKDYVIEFVPTKGRPKKLYHATLNMGKELGMVEGNAKGRQIREYYIRVEDEYVQELKQNRLIDGKDPQAMIRGLKSQLVQHIKKIELQSRTIDELIAENATLALPAPSEDVERYKGFIGELQEQLNEAKNRGDHFEVQSGNMLVAFKKRDNIVKVVKSFKGRFLNNPEVYDEIENMVMAMEKKGA